MNVLNILIVVSLSVALIVAIVFFLVIANEWWV